MDNIHFCCPNFVLEWFLNYLKLEKKKESVCGDVSLSLFRHSLSERRSRAIPELLHVVMMSTNAVFSMLTLPCNTKSNTRSTAVKQINFYPFTVDLRN